MLVFISWDLILGGSQMELLIDFFVFYRLLWTAMKMHSSCFSSLSSHRLLSYKKVFKINRILKTAEKIIDGNRLYFRFGNWRSSISTEYVVSNFLLSRVKVFRPRPFLLSLLFSKFWKQNSMHFGFKNIKTGLNCLHEFTTFLKYHMPLISKYTVYIVLQEFGYVIWLIHGLKYILKGVT